MHFSKIRSALRGGSLKYASRYQALQSAKRNKPAGQEGKHRFVYLCNSCNASFTGKEVEVDHIIAAGSLTEYSDLPGYVERLFCEPEGLQVLCKPCHKLKTATDRAKIKAAKNES